MEIDIRGLHNELQLIDTGLEVDWFKDVLEVYDHNEDCFVVQIYLSPMKFEENKYARDYMGDEKYNKIFEIMLSYILKARGYVIQEEKFYLRFKPPFYIKVSEGCKYLNYMIDKEDYIIDTKTETESRTTIFTNSDIMNFPDDIRQLIIMNIFIKEVI